MAELLSFTTTHRALRRRARYIPGAATLWWRGPADSRPSMSLTFDDGPDEVGTSAIARVLDRHQIPATFFLLVSRARKTPTLCQELVARGHEIGLHADTHQRLDRVPLAVLTRDLKSWRAELEDLVGVAVHHHRPPYGALSWRGLIAARRAGLDVVLWSHDPRDWEHPTRGPSLVSTLSGSLVPGAIVLLHDGVQWPDGSQGSTTAGALDQVLEQVRPSRPVAVTVSELLAAKAQD